MRSYSAVALLSGGMDSTTLAYLLRQYCREVHLLSVNYGQRHKKELEYAKVTAQKLHMPHTVLDLSVVQALLGGSALTSPDVPVPEGHYTAESMKATVVPNRNMIMLAIAAGYAISHKLDIVATAVHAGDHAIYPDCRPEFITALGLAIRLGNAGFGEPELHTPFINWSKTDIARKGDLVGVPWQDTWSCYAGRERHCGKCGTCVERMEAFRDGKVVDQTEYE